MYITKKKNMLRGCDGLFEGFPDEWFEDEFSAQYVI